MRIASAVTTCVRNGADYLPDTLQSVQAAGFRPEIVRDEKMEGSWPTLRRALAGLVERTTDPDDCLIVFQDDLEVAAGLEDWVRRNFWPDDFRRIGVCSLYCAAVNLREQDGWTDLDSVPVWRPYGALCYAFPRASAELLLSDYSNSGFMSGADTSVGSTCRKHGLRYLFRSPGFVQHKGTVSAIHPFETPMDENRSASRWISDVSQLPPRAPSAMGQQSGS